MLYARDSCVPVSLCRLSIASNPATDLNPGTPSKNGVDLQRVQGFWNPPPCRMMWIPSYRQLLSNPSNPQPSNVTPEQTSKLDPRKKKKRKQVQKTQLCTCAESVEMIGRKDADSDVRLRPPAFASLLFITADKTRAGGLRI